MEAFEFGIGNVTFILFIVALVFVFKTVNVVPQQHAWVVERLGRYHATLGPGLNIVVPFYDRVAYKHILKEIPLDVPPQVCITRQHAIASRWHPVFPDHRSDARLVWIVELHFRHHAAGADHAALRHRPHGAR